MLRDSSDALGGLDGISNISANLFHLKCRCIYFNTFSSHMRKISNRLFIRRIIISSDAVFQILRSFKYIYLPRGLEAPLFYYCSRKLCSSTFIALLHILSAAVPLKMDEQSQHYEEKQQSFGNLLEDFFENHRIVAR